MANYNAELQFSGVMGTGHTYVQPGLRPQKRRFMTVGMRNRPAFFTRTLAHNSQASKTKLLHTRTPKPRNALGTAFVLLRHH
jgi:hypothetical protein